MEIKYFKLIKAIAEEGSIANSSAKLFLTQSALSHQLKSIESQLGFKIFFRSRNKWELTEEGKALYEMSCKVLNNIEEGFEDINQISRGSAGNIRVSTECYSFYQSLPSFIQKMAILYPQIKVDLILEATHTPVSKLLSKEIDIAMVSSQPKDASLASVEIFEDAVFAIMHFENALCEEPYLHAKHFENAHLIIHSFPLETVSVYEHFLKPNGVTPSKISAVPLTEVALELVHANMGVMCMPKWALSSFKMPKELRFKKLGKNGLQRKHYLTVREEDRDKKYIRDFMMNFKESFLKKA